MKTRTLEESIRASLKVKNHSTRVEINSQDLLPDELDISHSSRGIIDLGRFSWMCLKKNVDELPWQQGQAYNYSFYPHLFVVPPLSPVGIGLCQDYYGSACTGISDVSKYSSNAGGTCGVVGGGCRGLTRGSGKNSANGIYAPFSYK